MTFPKYLDRTKDLSLCIAGIGNAGVNLLDRLLDGPRLAVKFVAMNSDQHSLSGTLAPSQISLGSMTTRGLGAGGDPETGAEAVRESIDEIKSVFEGVDAVILCMGLGGGTASGGAALVAQAARDAGALVISVATTPFAFEGRRRINQANAATNALAQHSDALLVFANDRMSDLVAPRAGVAETFEAGDLILADCISALVRLLEAPGPLPVGLPDLLSVLRSGGGACFFGTGESSGANRSNEALEHAFKSPLMDSGGSLDEITHILVHVSGPVGLAFAEVSSVMRQISKGLPASAMLHLGVSTSEDPSAPFGVTIFGKSCHVSAELPTHGAREPSDSPLERPQQATLPGVPAGTPHKTKVPASKQSGQKIKQETLVFEPVATGRFEKSDPTIVEGENLDTPTFLRRNIKL